jgi:hypothetical protein
VLGNTGLFREVLKTFDGKAADFTSNRPIDGKYMLKVGPPDLLV